MAAAVRVSSRCAFFYRPRFAGAALVSIFGLTPMRSLLPRGIMSPCLAQVPAPLASCSSVGEAFRRTSLLVLVCLAAWFRVVEIGLRILVSADYILKTWSVGHVDMLMLAVFDERLHFTSHAPWHTRSYQCTRSSRVAKAKHPHALRPVRV